MKAFFKRLSGGRKQRVSAAPRAAKAAVCSCEERRECRILIVCKGKAFSRVTADYAVTMAQKTRSSLVALNLDESGRDFEGFCNEAKRNIEYFSCRAKDAGLGFSHEVRKGAEDAVVAQLHENDPSFRYVMDDSAGLCRNRSVIPVYTRATLRAK